MTAYVDGARFLGVKFTVDTVATTVLAGLKLLTDDVLAVAGRTVIKVGALITARALRDRGNSGCCLRSWGIPANEYVGIMPDGCRCRRLARPSLSATLAVPTATGVLPWRDGAPPQDFSRALMTRFLSRMSSSLCAGIIAGFGWQFKKFVSSTNSPNRPRCSEGILTC